MEESLQDNLPVLRSVIENAPFPIGVYSGKELKIILANDAMVKVWGKGSEVIGKCYTEILPELESQKIFSQAQSVLETGIPFEAKNSRVDIVINGILKTHYFNYSFTPIRDSAGNIYAVMNTGTDVTDLYLSAQRIQHVEEGLQLAVAAGDLGTYVSNLLTNEVETSENFDKIWGISSKMPRAAIVEKIHPDDRTVREAAHAKAAITGNLCYEARLSKGKTYRWVRVKGKIIKDENESPVRLIGVVQDITEQKEFAQELQNMVSERTAELNKSNTELQQFANIVSHDLKEPVRKIATFSRLLQNGLEEQLSPKDITYFDKILHSANRMSSIIEDVLRYSTLNKEGHPVEAISLNTIIEEIKTDLELLIQEKKAILIKEELPEIDGATILIHQLFYNLIHNALKFSAADRPPKVIVSHSLISGQDRNYVQISIKDNGIGFDPAYAEKIFNAFERLHSKDVFEGTGLGLSLCRKIVERHHGTIHAKGGMDDGAEFIICLPLKQEGNKII